MPETSAADMALIDDDALAGFIEPLIGREVLRDVHGYYGFPLIKKGQPVTRNIAEKALSLGRLFELTDATEPA